MFPTNLYIKLNQKYIGSVSSYNEDAYSSTARAGIDKYNREWTKKIDILVNGQKISRNTLNQT